MDIIYLDDFLIRAIAVGICIAIVGGVLGCFIVWKKMAYFGDSIAHSALLGVLLGILMGWDTYIGIILICLLFIGILLWLEYKNIFGIDSLLGLLAHTGLSLAIVGLSLSQNSSIDLHALLFGDILTTNNKDIFIAYTVGIIILSIIIYFWDKLILIVIHKDLAKAEGISVFYYNILLMLLISSIVAVSFKIVGVLLITSILIIPSTTSRMVSKSPEMMAIISVIIGIVGTIGGIIASSIFDTPSGPSIVLALASIFVLLFIFTSVKNKSQFQ